MSKACNVLHVGVNKENQKEAEELLINEERYDGEFIRTVIKTGTFNYCIIGFWDNQQAISAAEAQIAEFFERNKRLFEKVPLETLDSFQISGEAIGIDGIDWRTGALSEYSTDDFEYNEPPEWEP